MRRWLGRLLLLAAALTLLAAAWLWWNRPLPVDMTAYAPADTILYLEANSLPDIMRALTSTDAWRTLAPPAGVNPVLGELGWLSRAAAWTGVGPSQTVLLGRAQVAVAVLGFAPGLEEGIKPRLAVIAETHTGRGRTRAAAEELIGDFARRAIGEPGAARTETDDGAYIVWSSPDGRKKIVASVAESLVVVGNDEQAVQACLAVRRGERQSLQGNPHLEEMREHVGAEGALAFGYVPPAGAQRLAEVAAVVYGARLIEDPQVQRALPVFLPQLAGKLSDGAAWSTRFRGGVLEDRYHFALPHGMAARLREGLMPSPAASLTATPLLPSGTYQLTRYGYRDTSAAWGALTAAVSSQVDATLAPLVVRALNEFLRPFGIDEPREFLRAAGDEITTARLDRDGAGLLLIARVRDHAALDLLLRKHLGGTARAAKVGDAELLVSNNAEPSAACYVGDYLLVGDEEDVRRCLTARADARTLSHQSAMQQYWRFDSQDDPPGVVTLTDDAEDARRFISFVARQRGARKGDPPDAAALRRALAALPYALSETRLGDEGFEKRTRSAFGQFGAIAALLEGGVGTGK